MSVDLTWVEKTKTVYVNDPEALEEIEKDPEWRLIATGNGVCHWTTLTFGWPWTLKEEEDGG